MKLEMFFQRKTSPISPSTTVTSAFASAHILIQELQYVDIIYQVWFKYM